jgi:hypothetical protein
MPRWTNGPLTAFHGTDSFSLSAYGSLTLHSPLAGFAVNLALCRRNTDFGQGFYLTTSDHQARQWANTRVRRLLRPTGPPLQAVVLSFAIDRDLIAGADVLAFVLATSDYWDLVHDCRLGLTPHARPGARQYYDIVYGPVSLWRQELIIHDADQISIHDQALANRLPQPIVYQIAALPGGLF